MNTRHNLLAIVSVAFVLFILGLIVDLSCAEETAGEKKPFVELSDEEKAWIREHPVIRVGVDHYPPFGIVDGKGDLEGLGAEYLRRIGENTGLNFRILTGLTRAQVQEGARNKIIDLIPVITDTADRRKFLRFTEGYLHHPQVVITRREHPAVTGIADLKGKNMAVSESYSEIEDLNRDYPSIRQVVVRNPLEELKLVALGQVDACQGNLTVFSYYIDMHNLINLKVAGPSDIGGNGAIAMGIRKDWPLLHSIIKKGLQTIDASERIAIARKWAPDLGDTKQASRDLTSAEKAWLADHEEITVGYIPGWPPYSFLDSSGRPVGISIDFFELVAKKVGLKFKVNLGAWNNIYRRGQDKEIDVVASMTIKPQRKQWFIFPRPYLGLPVYIVARKDDERIRSRDDLKGKIISQDAGSWYVEEIRDKFPTATLKLVGRPENTLLDVSIGKADATLAVSVIARHTIANKGLYNLHLAGEYAENEVDRITFGVRNDYPELASIIDKGLAGISETERLEILNRWVLRAAEPREKAKLTAEEKAWLADHPVMRLGVDPGWAPIEYLDTEGKLAGITADHIRILTEKMGTRFEMSGSLSWSDVLQKARQGKIDIIPAIVKSDERSPYLLFTQPYLRLPMIIVTRDDAPVIEGIQDLKGKTIAVVEDFITHTYLKRDYPDQELLLIKTLDDALRAVDDGQADALIENASAYNLAKNRLEFKRLMVAAPTPYAYELSIGVRKDWPELIPILEKTLASITPREKEIIMEKWGDIRFQKQTDWRTVIWISSAILLLAGGIVGLFHFSNRRLVREVNQRREAEAALASARDAAESANQAKSIFLANISHELRTPLNAILGFSSVLGRDSEATAAQKEKLAIINKSGENLLAMINDVLDLSKIEAGKIELQENPFDLIALVKEISVMIKSHAAEKGLYVKVETESINFPYVKSDVGKLRQILTNLLSNAVKFTDEGGVTIRGANELIPEKPNRCLIVIEVEDTGPGIDPARQARIFEPFVQGIDQHVRKGTGLGLAISIKFAELMGGAIELQSEVGKGSILRVQLPAEITGAPDVKTSVDIKPKVIGLAPTQKKWRILIADDIRDNLLLLKSLLEEAGFLVIEAKNGQEALAAFKKESPDLIWMDMRMPVMDGYEATRQIRLQPGGDKIPIIAITANAFRNQQPQILAAGCNDMVLKPLREHEIFESMARFLGVEYRYAEPDDAASPADAGELTATMLADLPPKLLQDLDKTMLVGKREVIFKMIEGIAELAPETAEHLRVLVHNFEMERIRDLIAEVT